MRYIGYGLLILVLIFILAVGRLFYMERNRNEEDTRITMDSLASRLKGYRQHCGVFPSTSEGLEALASKNYPHFCKDVPTEGFIEGGLVPHDSWDNKYKYSSDGQHFSMTTSSEDYHFKVTDEEPARYTEK